MVGMHKAARPASASWNRSWRPDFRTNLRSGRWHFLGAEPEGLADAFTIKSGRQQPSDDILPPGFAGTLQAGRFVPFCFEPRLDQLSDFVGGVGPSQDAMAINIPSSSAARGCVFRYSPERPTTRMPIPTDYGTAV